MTVVLLAHGSPDPRHGRVIAAIAEAVQARLGRATLTAFLEHEEPSVATAAATLPDGHLDVVPMLITPAYHAKVDVPAAAEQFAAPGREVRVTDPLGGEPALMEGVASVLTAAGHDPGGPALLIAGGNRSGSALRSLRDLVGEHGSPQWAASEVPAIEGMTPGTLPEGVPADAPVVPFTLAEGILHDRAAQWAARVGLPFVPGGIGLTAEVLDLVARRAAGD